MDTMVSQLQMINDMVADTKEQMDTLTDLTKFDVETIYGLDYDRSIEISGIKPEVIDTICESYLDEYLIASKVVDGEKVYSEPDLQNLKDDNPDFKDKTLTDYKRYILRGIADNLIALEEGRVRYGEFVEERDSLQKDYHDYINSPEYLKIKEEKLVALKEACEKEEDPDKKKEMQNSIDVLESFKTLDFIFTRLNKFGDIETKSIIDSFLDDDKSIYVLNRYKNKIKQLFKNDDMEELHKYLYNLEEKFLPEEFLPYNNLFLFFSMKFIAYGDMNDKLDRLYSSNLLMNLYKLIYHTFPNGTMEKDFLDIIKQFLSYFTEYEDLLKKQNPTYDDAVKRLENEKRMEEERIEEVIAEEEIEEFDETDIIDIGENANSLFTKPTEIADVNNAPIEVNLVLNKDEKDSANHASYIDHIS